MTPDSSDSAARDDSLSAGVWWFDAEVSRRLRASLHFANGTVRAENEDGARRDAKLSEVQISPRLGNTPRKMLFADGTCIVAEDNDRMDALIFRHGGGGKSFALHRLERKWTVALMCAAFAGAVLWWFATAGAPLLAEFGADRIPRAQLAALDDEVYMQMKTRGMLSDADIAPAAAARMERIFARVADSLAEEGDDFRMRLHDFPPNAFALPGGRVVVSAALAELLTDDELAAVFAHEIGHIRLRHGMRSVLLGSAVGLLALFAGDISGVSLGFILLHLGYSRDHEREADCFAYAYLRDNGMSPALVGDALEKMEHADFHSDSDSDSDSEMESESESETESEGESESGDNKIFSALLAALSTHPQTEARKNPAAFCETN